LLAFATDQVEYDVSAYGVAGLAEGSRSPGKLVPWIKLITVDDHAVAHISLLVIGSFPAAHFRGMGRRNRLADISRSVPDADCRP